MIENPGILHTSYIANLTPPISGSASTPGIHLDHSHSSILNLIILLVCYHLNRALSLTSCFSPQQSPRAGPLSRLLSPLHWPTMAEKPSVLIIGGLGYIGRFLALHIHKNNLASEVRVVDKVLPQLAWLAPEFDEACAGDKFMQADASRERKQIPLAIV